MTLTKTLATMIPFILLHTSAVTPTDATNISSAADGILKYGELGLCLVLVVYLMWNNYNLTKSITELLKEKTAQEERLIRALNSFCNACNERPCLLGSAAFKDGTPTSVKE